MPKSTDNDNLIDNDLSEGEVWSEGAEAIERQVNAGARNTPKWRSIEQYWEERRLREHLKDYLVDED